MNRPHLDQGTILTRIRCEKYPEINCFGIIVTASCDIAQRKVQKYYYVTALDAKKWITTEVGFNYLLADEIKNRYDALKKEAEGFISIDTLTAMTIDEAKNAISNLQIPEEMGKRDKISQLSDRYDKYAQLVHPGITIQDRSMAIIAILNESNKKKESLIKKLKAIYKGEINQYYYLPMNAFSERHDVGWIGLVLDFQELGFFYQRDLERLMSPGFDPFTLDELNIEITGYTVSDCVRYNQIFFMDDTDVESEGNSVEVTGCIHSPWREHMMQHFSFAFSRIGLEELTNSDFENLAMSVKSWPFGWKR